MSGAVCIFQKNDNIGEIVFGIGMPELIVIVVVALLVVGPKKLPDLAKSLGKGLQEFKKASDGVTDSIKETLKSDDLKEDMEDFKDSLLYGKKDEDEQPSALPPKDVSSKTSS